jgi:large subunit ribosomal protein L30
MAKQTQITVTLVRSPHGRKPKQGRTLDALGLRKVGYVKTFNDSPSLRGMLDKVVHLVKVESA